MNEWGYTFGEVRRAESQIGMIKQMRFQSANQGQVHAKMEEVMETTKRRFRRVVTRTSSKKEERKLWEAARRNSQEFHKKAVKG